MKAAVVTEFGSGFHVADVELDSPAAREVIVEVRASGLCHSDYTVAASDYGFPVPAVFGHEVAGVVTEVGPEVRTLRSGDHVVACLVQSCGTCAKCIIGRPYQCLVPGANERGPDDAPRLKHPAMDLTQGFGVGGFAEKVLVHERMLVKVPEALPFAQAAIIGCGVVTGAGSVLNSAAVRAGDTVVVVGAGGVGLNAVQAASLVGASRIVAVDLQQPQLDRAAKLGATDVVRADEGDPVDAVRAALPDGADHVFDFVGVRSVTEQAFGMVGMGGGLYLIGSSSADPGLDVDARELMMRHAKVQGVGMGSTNPHRDIPVYADLYLQGRYDLDALVSRTIALDEIDAGYAAMKAESLARVVITRF